MRKQLFGMYMCIIEQTIILRKQLSVLNTVMVQA